jgi:O-methyltransferase
MTEPTEHDTSPFDRPALESWKDAEAASKRQFEGFFDPELFSEDRVRENLLESGYPGERLHFVKGKVEETIPGNAPETLALLRLDTDWYESTRHELEHLYPRLSAGGVLIVDDYGHWRGCRKAVDEYFARTMARPLLNRIDYTARIGIRG